MISSRGELVNKTFRLRSDWVKQAEKRAIDENRSLTEVVEEAIERYGSASGLGGGTRLVANARARTEQRRRQFGGRFPDAGPLSRDSTYER